MPEMTILGWFHTVMGVGAVLSGFYTILKYKIISLDDLINKPINSISFKVKNVDEVNILSKMLKKGGDVEVNINIVSSDKAYKVKLKDKRLIDRKTVNLIKNQGISTTIH